MVYAKGACASGAESTGYYAHCKLFKILNVLRLCALERQALQTLVGPTQDLSKRIRQHNIGESKYTKGGIPWRIVYFELVPDIGSARRQENFLKSGVGMKWLDELPN